MEKTLSCCGVKYYDSIIAYIVANKELINDYELENLKEPNCEMKLGEEKVKIYHSDISSTEPKNDMIVQYGRHYSYSMPCYYCPRYVKDFMYQYIETVECTNCKKKLCDDCYYASGGGFYYEVYKQSGITTIWSGLTTKLSYYESFEFCEDCFKKATFTKYHKLTIVRLGKCINNHPALVYHKNNTIESINEKEKNDFVANLLKDGSIKDCCSRCNKNKRKFVNKLLYQHISLPKEYIKLISDNSV